MDFSHIIAFNLTLFAAIASPGPALLVAIQTSLASGKRAGIAVGFGLGLVASLWTLAALLGLEAIFLLFPWAFIAAKFIGAFYLLYIAFCMWRSAGNEIQLKVKPASRAFRQGVIVNALNPKSVLFAAAVLVVIFPKDMTLSDNLFIVANHFLIEILFYTLIAISMSQYKVRDHYLRSKKYLDRFASGVLGFLGLKLLLERSS